MPTPPLRIPRPPEDDEELWQLIRVMWGITLPRTSVCPNHSSPFEAVAHAFFGREPGYAVWYASRGSGKSLALAVLGLTKTFVLDVDTTILGGSIWQSQNVRAHMSKLFTHSLAPKYAIKKDIVTALTTHTNREIKPLPASQTSVRGPHPPLTLLDEVDEMEKTIYDAAMGQAMEQVNSRGELINEYIVASSTWQHPDGTFTEVIDNARIRGLPVFTWCWRELLAENGGWMSKRFIEQKRKAVSAEMWKTEYELNEPSGASRAFDLDAVERYFVPYGPAAENHGQDDDEWIWAEPELNGLYAAGADWAQERDKTVFAVIRYDVQPRQLVYLRRVNRQSYKTIIAAFDSLVGHYHAAATHDRTGLGRVVHDLMDNAEGGVTAGFDFTNRAKRSEMLVAYIADFEGGGYRLPRDVVPLYKAHRNTTVADVYGSHQWNAHLPDEVAAMALAHRSAGRLVIGAGHIVTKDPTVRRADALFHVQPPVDNTRREGEILIVDERYEDVVDIPWLYTGADQASTDSFSWP